MIGENYFSAKGVSFHLYGEGIELVGKLKFGAFQKLRYDIMGPFRYIPHMECRHKVFSMKHTVNGTLYLNGVEYHFENGSKEVFVDTVLPANRFSYAISCRYSIWMLYFHWDYWGCGLERKTVSLCNLSGSQSDEN